MRRRRLLNLALLALLVLPAAVSGCGRPAEAGPVQVTYYYLPG